MKALMIFVVLLFMDLGLITGGLIESNPAYLWIPGLLFVAAVATTTCLWHVVKTTSAEDVEDEGE